LIWPENTIIPPFQGLTRNPTIPFGQPVVPGLTWNPGVLFELWDKCFPHGFAIPAWAESNPKPANTLF
jgi:hypothetical protein